MLSDTLWDYILVYLLLLLSAGFFFRQQYNRYTIPMYLTLLFLTIINRKIKLKRDILIPTLLLMFLIILTAILTGLGYYERYIYSIISTITAYLVTQIYSYKRFYRLFSNSLYYICIASIIGWLLVQLMPSVVMIFPRLVNSVGFDAHFLGLTILNVPSYEGYENRAMGIFWEPGAFQAMIVIAMIGDIFINDNSSPRKRYIVYFLALILTMSTTGYVCCFVLIAILLVKDKKVSIPKIIVLFSAIVGIIILFGFKENLPDYLYYTLFSKMEAVFHYRPGAIIGDVPAQKTAYVRMNSIYYPFVEYIKSPVWGIGFSGYDRIGNKIGYHNMFTFTLINYFAYFGLFYACISINGFLKTVKRINASNLCKFLIVLLIIIAVSSEDFCGGTACITVFLLYGYGKYNCEDKINRIEDYEKSYESSFY